MEPEKDIVEWYFKRKGYFTVSSIKAANNKEVELIALKVSNGVAKEVIHVETVCSVSQPATIGIEESLRLFRDSDIIDAINAFIKGKFNKKQPIGRLLVIGAAFDADKAIDGVRILPFSRILADVIEGLDKQNYQNYAVRQLQVIKYIVLSREKESALLLSRTLKGKSKRERFLRAFLDATKADVFRGNNELLETALSSAGRKPEELADILGRAMTQRRLSSLARTLVLKMAAAKPVKKVEGERTLKDFVK